MCRLRELTAGATAIWGRRLRACLEEVLGQFDNTVRVYAESIEHETFRAEPIGAQPLAHMQRGDLPGKQTEFHESAVW